MEYGFLIRSILLQVVVFCIVPFIYWLARKRKGVSFFKYVGLTLPQKPEKYVTVLVFAFSYIIVYGTVHFVPAISGLTQPSANAYAGLGISAIIPAIFVCFIQQAFAEEILFRGFIGKWFIGKIGFNGGNIAQAIVFGMVHVLLSISNDRNIVSYLIVFVSIAAGGWLLGYLDEKICKGTIIPSILLHGLGNFIMVMSVAF